MDKLNVPYVAVPPAGGERPDAPVVVGYHLLDAPRTEVAFAAAVPLDGLDAWKLYFGLPMSGSRMPAGGREELWRLVSEDPIRNVYRHVALGALGATVDWQVVPEMAHALADEPGVDAATQTPQAAAVDRLAVEWFREHLTG